MYRRIFEDSMDGMFLWNNQYQIVNINFAAEQMLGLSKERIIGRSLFEIYPEDKKQEIREHFERVYQYGENSSSIVFDIRGDKQRHFDYSTKREIVEGLNVTVFKDITEKVEIEQQLRKSETLNVIGELAAGIAHEIRNPMTALKGFIQLLESSIKKEHTMYYQVITSELERIDSIINEFLLLAKPKEIRFQEKDIQQIMKETIDLLNAQALLHNVQFITAYDEPLPLIFCEPNQLKKVFVNLIKNAIEVMPNGGAITVTISKEENHQIHISIKDEGFGISKEKINKLGEPFFTTKERGTGLGLMVSYRIIEEHKGVISAESEEGKGTVFHIFLPVNHMNYS
ncbi:PAS domain S-box protein [Bacillus sp. BRMEA1]|nr:PAS domain S-box protein [Neobacillus endophyticus]